MYNNLTLITSGNKHYVSSREVAELIGKEHNHLLRDIRNYIEVIKKIGASKVGYSDFFIESSYRSSQNRVMPCYLLSKMGCEMVANKLIGEKGILFTALYVTKFNDMEDFIKSEQVEELEKLRSLVNLPTLADYNDTAKIVIAQLRRIGVTNDRIIYFLNNLYEPLGISIANDEDLSIPYTYTATQIAWIYGVYSLYGNPHAHAVSCIINENMCLNSKHKLISSDNYDSNVPYNYRYDEYALEMVGDWLDVYGYPSSIYASHCTYHVIYKTKKDN